MACLNKEALILRTIDAIVADGWNVVRLNQAGTHPARFMMEQDNVSHTVRLYSRMAGRANQLTTVCTGLSEARG